MAKRDPVKMKKRRQQQVRRQLTAIFAVVLAAFLVILFITSRRGRRPGETQNAVTPSAQTESAAESRPATPEEETAVSSAAEASAVSEAETPAVIVREGSIGADGTVTFVNDPAYSEKITILGTGDNLIHEALFLDARTEDGGYDFRPMYERVKPYIQEADIATVNQETPLATALAEPSGYPSFNSPVQVADALSDAGFDIFNFANNHVLDMGESGIQATLDCCDERGIPYFGVYRDSEDRSRIRVLEKNGITVAFLGFVNWTNKDPTEETENQLTWLSDEESVKYYIEKADEIADIVVVYAHWGEENENVITDEMSSMSRKMVNWGADVIFGDHTHLVQKITVLQREGDGALCPVQFCGGNFISGQKERNHLLSVLTTVEFAKNPDTGEVAATGMSALPLVTHYEGDRENVCIYPLKDYTEELANANGVKQFEMETMTTDYLWDLIHAEIPDQFLAG